MKNFFFLLFVTFNIFSFETNQDEGLARYEGFVSPCSSSLIVDSDKSLAVFVRIDIDQGLVNIIREFRRTKKENKNEKISWRTVLSLDAQFEGNAICDLIPLSKFQKRDGSFKQSGDFIKIEIDPIKAIFELQLTYSRGTNPIQSLYNKYLEKISKNKCVIL